MGNQTSHRQGNFTGCEHEMCQYGQFRNNCRWTAGSSEALSTVSNSVADGYGTFPGVLRRRPPGTAKKKTLRIAPYRRYPSIVKIPGLATTEEPDVVSLGLPFWVCRLIFVRLSLADLGRCMQVCKEWRSLIDTCDFWCLFLRMHYDLELRTPAPWSALHEWRHRASCMKVSVTPALDKDRDPTVPRTYVFRPFPELWRAGILVPYGLQPPEGRVQRMHGFLHALRWLERLAARIDELGVRRQLRIEPCLMPWDKERMPTPHEVLDAFSAHINIIRSVYDARTLTPQELRSYYGLLRSRYRGPQFDERLYYWFTDHAHSANLIFDCNPDVVDPTPSFILTRLAADWVGGAIYAV